jgi:hypothetical protein
MAPQPAALQIDGDRHALRFERLLSQPPERVWSALNHDYERRFGIPADQATPPPG